MNTHSKTRGDKMKQIGPLYLLEGKHNSKVPYSRSIYINCKEKVLIDTGADPEILTDVHKQYGVANIMNTHYHPDHTSHNHLFPEAVKWINPIEFKTARTIEGIARANGVYQEWGEVGIEMWKKQLPREWVQNLGEITRSYDYDKEYIFGDVKVLFLHTPGHTSGLASPYFPDLGVVYVSDYDMTTFGPWYNGTDGDIDDFIASGKYLTDLDVTTYVTGHQKGIFSKSEFVEEMEKFLQIIETRNEIIERYAKQGLTFEELTNIGIFYPANTLNVPIFQTWERSGIRKHLQRLGLTVLKSNGELVIQK